MNLAFWIVVQNYEHGFQAGASFLLQSGEAVSSRWELVLGLLEGFFCGLGAVVQHYVLRFVLVRYHYAPWDYPRFLEHAAKHGFIERVGGRYRFLSDRLRQRFADRYQAKRMQTPE